MEDESEKMRCLAIIIAYYMSYGIIHKGTHSSFKSNEEWPMQIELT